MRASIFSRLVPLGVALITIAACSSSQRTRPVPGSIPGLAAVGPNETAKDPSTVYNQMGLIATSSPLSYVGKIAYFASRSADTTLVLASISIPNRVLSFVRDGDTYRAPYEVKLKLTQGAAEVRSVESLEIVRRILVSWCGQFFQLY